MQVDEFNEFHELMQKVYSFFGKSVSDFELDLWWGAMRPYAFNQVKEAMGRHVVNPDQGQFLPKPADMVRLLDGGAGDNAQLAWAKVDKAVRMVGCYQSVVFDDAIIHTVLMDMGGWIALGNCTEKEWPFKAREFEKRYRGYTLRGLVEYKRKLIGIAEAQNETAGKEIKPPIMIGEPEKCRLVYKGGKEQMLTMMRRLDVEVVINTPVQLMRD